MPKSKKITEKSFNILAEVDTDAIRHEDFEGEDHLVVPLIALVEGVLRGANAATPELALAEVFGLFPLSWNGRPVTLDHPEIRGMKVSAAQTPEIFENEALGFLFNTTLDDKKLKTEAWINLSRVEDAGEDVVAEIKRFESGEIVEVSTGLFALTEQANGTFEGEDYNAIWIHIAPDHLAILPEGTIGACSVEDGCGGPRTNKACDCEVCQLKENEMADDKETDEDIKDQDKHDPEEDARKKKEEEDEKDNSGHTPKKKRKKMKAQSENEEGKSIVHILSDFKEKFDGIFKLRAHKELSDIDTRRALTAGLVAEDAHAFFEIIAVFDNSFVYAKGFDGTLLERGFSIADEGEIALNSEVTEVRPVTEFVPVNLTNEEEPMTNKKVDELIVNEATKFNEDDRKWLESQNDDRLDSLFPVANSEGDEKLKENDKLETNEALEDKGSDDADVTANSQTAEEFIADAPAEMQEVLSDGLRMQREEKTKLVTELVANKRCTFDEDELKDMKIAQLKKLAQLGNTPSYEGQTGNAEITANQGDDNISPAPVPFPRKSAANE